jgi:hypothetical protein
MAKKYTRRGGMFTPRPKTPPRPGTRGKESLAPTAPTHSPRLHPPPPRPHRVTLKAPPVEKSNRRKTGKLPPLEKTSDDEFDWYLSSPSPSPDNEINWDFSDSEESDYDKILRDITKLKALVDSAKNLSGEEKKHVRNIQTALAYVTSESAKKP